MERRGGGLGIKIAHDPKQCAQDDLHRLGGVKRWAIKESKALFKISNAKTFGLIGLLITLAGGLINLYVNPQAGQLFQDAAPKLFVLEAVSAGPVSGTVIVSATEIVSDTAE